ncbi:MAG: hypothetical protein ACOZQL_14395 [Myxococcota bacterium]
MKAYTTSGPKPDEEHETSFVASRVVPDTATFAASVAGDVQRSFAGASASSRACAASGVEDDEHPENPQTTPNTTNILIRMGAT